MVLLVVRSSFSVPVLVSMDPVGVMDLVLVSLVVVHMLIVAAQVW